MGRCWPPRLQADITPGPAIFLGGREVQWDSWACLDYGNINTVAIGAGESKNLLQGIDVVYRCGGRPPENTYTRPNLDLSPRSLATRRSSCSSFERSAVVRRCMQRLEEWERARGLQRLARPHPERALSAPAARRAMASHLGAC